MSHGTFDSALTFSSGLDVRKKDERPKRKAQGIPAPSDRYFPVACLHSNTSKKNILEGLGIFSHIISKFERKNTPQVLGLHFSLFTNPGAFLGTQKPSANPWASPTRRAAWDVAAKRAASAPAMVCSQRCTSTSSQPLKK